MFPGVTTAAGGFLLLISGNRATAMFGGWLAVIAGAWFVVGRTLASTLAARRRRPAHRQRRKPSARSIEIASFSGLGALIVFLGGAVLARVTIRTARDVEYARTGRAGVDVHTFDASAGRLKPRYCPLSRDATGARAGWLVPSE